MQFNTYVHVIDHTKIKLFCFIGMRNLLYIYNRNFNYRWFRFCISLSDLILFKILNNDYLLKISNDSCHEY